VVSVQSVVSFLARIVYASRDLSFNLLAVLADN